MSAFTQINLEKLAPPILIDTMSEEDVLAAMKADLIERAPHLEATLNLEGEDILQALEVCAYREHVLRQRINDAAKSVMLAYAVGSDLEHLAALFGIERALIITDHGLDYTPTPVTNPELFERDARLRTRVQLALEGFTNAGSVGAYTFHALSSSGKVKDVSIESPAPGQVKINVLSSASAQGVADQTLLDVVSAAVNADDVRPLTDQVSVNSATIKTYAIEASLVLLEGPDASLVQESAQKAIEAYVSLHHRLGHDITLSGIFAALHQEGVHSVELATPTATIEVDMHEAAFCTSITLSIGGRDV